MTMVRVCGIVYRVSNERGTVDDFHHGDKEVQKEEGAVTLLASNESLIMSRNSGKSAQKRLDRLPSPSMLASRSASTIFLMLVAQLIDRQIKIHPTEQELKEMGSPPMSFGESISRTNLTSQSCTCTCSVMC